VALWEGLRSSGRASEWVLLTSHCRRRVTLGLGRQRDIGYKSCDGARPGCSRSLYYRYHWQAVMDASAKQQDMRLQRQNKQILKMRVQPTVQSRSSSARQSLDGGIKSRERGRERERERDSRHGSKIPSAKRECWVQSVQAG